MQAAARTGTAASDRDLFRRSLHRWPRAEMRHHQLARSTILSFGVVSGGDRLMWLHAGVELFEAVFDM